jgi:cytoskeletal protein CcmA (bactofilin family)
MFTKKSDKGPVAYEAPRSISTAQSSPAPLAARQQESAHQQDSGPSSVSQISADLTIIGNLVSRGEVQIDGEIQGDLHAASIVVGDNARITGNVVAEEVVVRGSVVGSVRGKRVLLQSNSKLEGDVFHQQLAIEQGAYFEGKSRRMEDPTAGIQRPEIAYPASNGHAT